MKTLHTDENTQKAAIESWVLDRIIAHEEFVVPFTSHPRVQQIVINCALKYSRNLSNQDRMYWMNVSRCANDTDFIGICFTPVSIDA